jgi:hypothetical protein
MLESYATDYPIRSSWDFPCLGKATFDETVIVLFTNSENGVVVASSSDDWEIGTPHEELEMSEWVPYYGKITIVCKQHS